MQQITQRKLKKLVKDQLIEVQYTDDQVDYTQTVVTEDIEIGEYKASQLGEIYGKRHYGDTR